MAAPGAGGRILLKVTYSPDGGIARHYYADGLPGAAKLYTVLSVLGSITATPLILLCCIPTVKSIKKVHFSMFHVNIKHAFPVYSI